MNKICSLLCWLLLPFFAQICFAQASLTQTVIPVDQARQLLQAGNAAAAFDLLAPLEDQFSGNITIDYLFGIAALDSGKADRATLAFERVIALNPNFAGARLDMARAYFQLGDLNRSKQEFVIVRGQNPPREALAVVDRYLEIIEKTEAAQQRQIRGYVDLATGRDSNINNSGSQATVNVPALGNLPFNLSPSNLATKDSFWTYGAGVEYTQVFSPGLSAFVGADLRMRDNMNSDRFDTMNQDGRLGVAIGEATNQLRLTLAGGRYELDRSLSRRAENYSGEWRYQINPANQLSLFSQYARNRFTDPATQINSFNAVTSGAAWVHILGEGKGLLLASLFGGNERDTEGRADGEKRFYGVRLGGQWSVQESVDLFGFGSTQRAGFGRINAAFLEKRNDIQSDFVVGANWRFAKDWTLRPQASYSRNSVNIPLYRYERQEISFNVRRDF